jgi:hypothetical protein
MSFKSTTLVTFCLAMAIHGGAKADTVVLGSDYLRTLAGTSFNFGAPIGSVDFKGFPIGPGNTDTIVQRTSDVTINDPAGGTLKIVALSLVSAAPVPLLGAPVYISLDPNHLADDTGQIWINGSAATGGAFSSTFHLYFDVCTAPGVKGVGCGSGNLLFSGYKIFDTLPGSTWLPTPPLGAVIVSGPVGDQWANLHSGLNPDQSDFWPAVTIHDAGDGRHVVDPAVPEASTWAMMLLGFAGLGFLANRRARDRQASKNKALSAT